MENKRKKVNYASATDDNANCTPTMDVKTQDSYCGDSGFNVTNNYANIAEYYQYLHNILPAFLGFQFLSVAMQIPIISNACNILPRACVKNWVTLVSSSEEDTKTLQTMQEAIDKKYKIKQKVKNHLKNALSYGGSLLFFDIEGQDKSFPLNIDSITQNSLRGVREIDVIMAVPLLNEEANNALSEWYFEPYAWQIMGSGNENKVHHSFLSKCVPEPVAPYLKPTYRYFGLSVTQKLLPYAMDNVFICKELQQLLKTKRQKVLATDTSAFLENEQEMRERLTAMTYLQNNYNLTLISNGCGSVEMKDELFQLDTSLADVTAVVDKSFEICSSIANIPFSKLLGTMSKGGLGSTGEFDLNTWHESVSEFQESNMRELLEQFYKIAFKSEFDFDCDFEVVFNPIDEVSQKETAEIRSLNNATLQALVTTGIITIEEARIFLLNDKESGFNDLPADAIDELGATDFYE